MNTYVERLTDFIDFAEQPGQRQNWAQAIWGWVKSASAYNLGLNDPWSRQLATDVRNGVCQSAFCAAGHGAFMAGNRLVYDFNSMIDGQEGLCATFCIAERPMTEPKTGLPVLHAGKQAWEDVPGAMMIGIATAGQEWYGLNDDQAEAFFYADNDIETLKALVNGFCYDWKIDPPYPGIDAVGADEHLWNAGERSDEEV